MIPFNYLSGRPNFKMVRDHTWNLFFTAAHEVKTEKWQGMETKDRPDLISYELMNYTFTQQLMGIEDIYHWQVDIEPNLPWADDHFKERVCGYPINPGVEWQNWPWGNSANRFRDNEQFNHNYMERYWPKYAGLIVHPTYNSTDYISALHDRPYKSHHGIRNEYGDLNDLVMNLVINPLSRQEWFPIFHPEDVGDVEGGRKPCSLGYQFMVRDNCLHVYYPLRSCDFFRHMQDDIYLTIRLLLWVLNKCRQICQDYDGDLKLADWNKIVPGTLTMHCTSLHVFANDMAQMKLEGPRK